MSRVTVIGAGYVGLVTAGGLAQLGHDVCCIDIDATKIDQLRSGVIPIHEVGLHELVTSGRDAGRLRFGLGHDPDNGPAEFFFLCVPTPEASDGAADTSYLEAAATGLLPAVAAGAIIVNKSTVPVGSTRLVEAILNRADVDVVSNPEFLREGSAVQDFLHPDRIVIGAERHDAAKKVQQLYQGIDTVFLLTDPVSAELIKYAANSFLATKLSFINSVVQSPALAVAERLRRAGVRAVHAHDPVASTSTDVSQQATVLSATRDANVVVVMTEWPELDLLAVRDAMQGDTIVDTRAIIDPVAALAAGITLEQLGRSIS